MQVAPTECSIEMMGCPLLSFGQQFFVDFGTGTTADNTYNVTGIDHKLDPGSFTTSVKLTFTDSFAKYSSPAKKIRTASSLFKNASTGNQTSDASGDGGRRSSNLVDSQNSKNLKPFFEATNSTKLIDSLLVTLDMKRNKKGEFQNFEFAMIVNEEDGSYLDAVMGESSLSKMLKKAATLDPKYCVITFHVHINMSGNKQVKVINPSSKKASGDDVINSLVLKNVAQPGHGNGTIIINLDDFADKAAEFISKRRQKQQAAKKKK
jgi:hypothetical protein